MPDMMNIASSALQAFQASMNAVSNNISNVNTEGYARQTVEFSSRQSNLLGGFYFGNGVQLSNVSRNTDEYVNTVMRNSYSSYAYSQTYTESARYVTDIISDPFTSVDTQIQRFYDELQTLTESPSNGAVREAFFNTAGDLAQRFNTTQNQILDEINNLHAQLANQANSLTSLLSNVADINRQIIQATDIPTHLLDSRDLLLKDISELIDITVSLQDDGTANVFIGAGQAAVVGVSSSTLAVINNPADDLKRELAVVEGSIAVPISEFATGGKIGAILNVRDDVHFDALNKLGRVALSLNDAFNNQARMGRDLEGIRGSFFFSDVNSTANAADRVIAHSNNAASANLSVSISDTSALKISDYTLSFNSSGANYSLMRNSDNTVVASGAIGALPSTVAVAAEGFSFTFAAGSTFNDADQYQLTPTRNSAEQIKLNITKPAQIPLAGAYLTTSNAANVSDMSISQPVIPPASYATYNAANPDARVYTVTFPTPTTYRVTDSDGGDTGGLAYTDGMTVTLNNGAEIELSGTPVVGDTFIVGPNTASAVGDARNGVLLGNTQTQQIIESSTLTFQTAFGALVTDMGVRTHQESLAEKANKAIFESNELRLSEVSGVNLDEEAANLLRFQQSYQAVSQVFNTSNAVFNALLGAIQG